MSRATRLGVLVAVALLCSACDSGESPTRFDFDLVFRGATLYLGDEQLAPGDLAIRAERIAAVDGAGIYFTQNESDVRAFAAQPWVATASDGLTMHDALGGLMHPRLYGTFPRKIRRYALDEGLISLGFALRSMTDLPADILGLAERGRLREGNFADVVAFDPERLRDVASFEEPGRHSEGVEFLLVNGRLAIDSGERTGVRAGRALRGAGYDAR